MLGFGPIASAPVAAINQTAGAPVSDTTKPVMNSPLSYGNLAFNSFILSVPAATDDTGVVSYAFSTDNGASFTNTGLTRTFNASGKTPSTLYHCQAVAYDAAGLVSDPLLLDVTTGAYVSAAGGANSSRRGSGGGRHRFST